LGDFAFAAAQCPPVEIQGYGRIGNHKGVAVGGDDGRIRRRSKVPDVRRFIGIALGERNLQVEARALERLVRTRPTGFDRFDLFAEFDRLLAQSILAGFNGVQALGDLAGLARLHQCVQTGLEFLLAPGDVLDRLTQAGSLLAVQLRLQGLHVFGHGGHVLLDCLLIVVNARYVLLNGRGERASELIETGKCRAHFLLPIGDIRQLRFHSLL
jgi:hypothetical protein